MTRVKKRTKKNRAAICRVAMIVLPALLLGSNLSIGADVNSPPADAYSYNPAGKPDPFVPFIEKDLIVKKKTEKASPASIFPLQNAGVDQFKLVGIAGNERRRIAIVEDERGKIYPLFEGTSIGQNNGRVKSILADRVIVEEKIRIESGGDRINRITIKLHKEDNEGKP